MYQVLVKQADTGRIHNFSQVDSIETLQQLIFQQIKVDIADQLILSKSGHRATSKDDLSSERILKETFLTDNLNKTSGSRNCFYLYNTKTLLRKKAQGFDEQYLIKESAQALTRMHQCSVTLREKLFQLTPLNESLSQDKHLAMYTYNAEIPEMADKMHKKIIKFVDNFNEFKENKECLNNYIEHYENQRKGTRILFKYIKIVIDDIKQKYKQQEQRYDSLVSTFDSNQSRYTEAQIKQINEEKALIQNNKKTILFDHRKIKEYFKDFHDRASQFYRQKQKNMKYIDGSIDKKYKEMTDRFKHIKVSYNALTDAIKQKFQKGNNDVQKDIKIMLSQRYERENFITQSIEKSIQHIKASEQMFLQIFKIYKQHQNNYRGYYKAFNEVNMIAERARQRNLTLQQQNRQFKKKIMNFTHQAREVPLEQNWISDPLIMNKVPSKKSQNSSQSINASLPDNSSFISPLLERKISIENNQNKSKLSNQGSSNAEREQKQLLRRKYFNKKLVALNQELKLILKEEHSARKMFMSEQISQNQFYHHPVLENINVPAFLLNFDETSDRQITFNTSANKSGLQRFEERQRDQVDLSFFRSSTGMDRVLLQLDIIKNCQVNLKKEGGGIQGKVKNLQTIIQKSADVFHHVYTHKISQVERKHENRQRHMEFRIGNLEKENNDLKQQLRSLSQKKNNENTEKIWLQEKINNLMNEIEGLRKINYEQSIKNKRQIQKHEIDKRKMEELLEDLKKKDVRMKQQEKEMKKFIENQLQKTEYLVIELEQSSLRIRELEDLNTEYKIVMGDQQVKIASLQSQLGQGSNNGKNLQASFYGDHLMKPAQKDKNLEKQLSSSRNQQMQENQENINKLEVTNKQNMEKKQQKDAIYENLQKEIAYLKDQLEDLRNQNDTLNDQLMKIAMKDTEDQSVQADEPGLQQSEKEQQKNIMREGSFSQYNPIMHNYVITQYQQMGAVVVKDQPKEGQFRVFIPYTPGVYVAAVSNQSPTDNSVTSYQTRNLGRDESDNCPYVLDLNILSAKARQLLKQCTLVVVVKITKILPGEGRWYVEGEIESAMGFEDNDMKIKDYGIFLKNQ